MKYIFSTKVTIESLKLQLVKRLLFAVLFLSTVPVFAQQVPLLNNFYRSPYLFNPGYARTDSVAEAIALYRNQWSGIQGAPETQLLALNGLLLKKTWTVGGTFYNDASNITRRMGAYLSSSYGISLGTGQQLRLGLAFGMLQNRIDFEKVKAQDPTEPILLSASDTRTVFDGNAGLYYTYNKLEAGISAMHLFNSRLNYANSTFDEDAGFQLLRHYFIFAKYNTLYEFANIRFSPLAMLRSTQSLPLGWDAGLMIDYKQLLWLSPVYKSNYGLALNLGVYLNKFIRISYAYEIPFNGIGPFSRNTHEFALAATFKSGERRAQPAYQAPAVQEQPKEKISKADKKKEKDAEKDNKKSYEDSHFLALEEKLDSLQARLNALSEHEHHSQEKIDSLEKHDKELADKLAKNKLDLDITKDELRRLEGQIHENLSEKHISFEEEHMHKDSLQELDNRYFNYYVVAGSYHDINAAKFMVRTLKSDYNIDAKLVQSKDGSGNYNVVTKQVYKREEAIEEISKLDLLLKKNLMPQGARLFQLRK